MGATVEPVQLWTSSIFGDEMSCVSFECAGHLDRVTESLSQDVEVLHAYNSMGCSEMLRI